MEKATGGILQAAPIRLQVGDKNFGFMHINLKHAEEIQNKGYSDAISYIKKILQNVDKIYSRADIGRADRFILFSKGAEGHSNDFMPIDFELEKGNDDYYSADNFVDESFRRKPRHNNFHNENWRRPPPPPIFDPFDKNPAVEDCGGFYMLRVPKDSLNGQNKFLVQIGDTKGND